MVSAASDRSQRSHTLTTDLRTKLIAYLAAATARKQPITDATEIYYDLGLYGDDIFEFVLWAEKELGIVAEFDMRKYCPGEIPFMRLGRALAKVFGQERSYQSFSVGLVLAAAKAGRWP